MTGNEIRENFLGFFEKHGHLRVNSSPLAPEDDPTLLFVNAGMVQFKSVFLGEEKRLYNRAVTSQKCLRVSGKHNDLEMVGRTPRHHTFFEMLGNFSFGDYFKEEAVEMAWEFLTGNMGLSPENLWVTIFTDDDEAHGLWNHHMGVPLEKIVRLGEKDNFWSMGDTGPCGPCSEILIDRGEHTGCGRPQCDLECDCGRYLELWNLVFMQFNRDASGDLTPLPKPSIDTGMGLERITSIMQGVDGNYSTDLLRPLIAQVEDMCGEEYGSGQKNDVSMQVIADHVRAIAFLLSDGVLPSNEGRGYVLRMILRRAARHGKMLGMDKPFLYTVTGGVVDIMKGAYPWLDVARDFIARFTLSEEERFQHTLDHGLNVLEEIIEKVRVRGESVIRGDDVFTLYDTYGFPPDLAEEVAAENGFTLDREGFQRALEGQRKRARAAMKTVTEEANPVFRELLDRHGPTLFTGYTAAESEGKILAVIKNGVIVRESAEGETVEIVLDTSPFYGEAGGQVGDTGTLNCDGVIAAVLDTVIPIRGLVVHKVKIKTGKLLPGTVVNARVDELRRGRTRLNHTTTHLLHAALKNVLGDHVKQSGSLVTPDRFRFDFSHFSPLTQRETERVEELINQRIMENHPVRTEVKSLEQALEEGAVALFGEKYGADARVVIIDDVSKELCGGTHTSATGDIGLFKIAHEAGVAAGVRRIEAVTGAGAYGYIRGQEESLKTIRGLLKAKQGEEVDKVKRLLDNHKKLEKDLREQRERLASADTHEETVKEIAGVKVLAAELPGMDINALRSYVDSRKQRLKSGVIVAGTAIENKVVLVAGVTDDLTARYHAGKIVKEVAGITGGNGGGRADMAQAGGTDTGKLKEALQAVYDIIERSQ